MMSNSGGSEDLDAFSLVTRPAFTASKAVFRYRVNSSALRHAQMLVSTPRNENRLEEGIDTDKLTIHLLVKEDQLL